MPLSTACADPACPANAIDRAQVMFVPRLGQVAVLQMHAEAGAEQRLLDIMRGQSVAGEELVDVAGADEIGDKLAAAGVDDRRPADQKRLAAFARVRNSSCATWRIATPLGFSVETALFMNSNAWRSIFRSSGNTRTPA